MHEILQEILWSHWQKDELPVDDAEFDEEILDNLTIDPFFRCPWSDCVVLPQYVGNGRFEGKVERL